MALADKNGNTELHFAAASGNLSVIDSYLKRGDDINVQNNFGQTPLHLAYKNAYKHVERSLESITFLMNRGADLNIRDSEGKIPFDLDSSGLK